MDHVPAGIMSRLKVALMHEEWVGMPPEVVFLPRDSFMLPNGLLIALVRYVCGAIGGLDSNIVSVYPTVSSLEA